jgi:hypothetical protein
MHANSCDKNTAMERCDAAYSRHNQLCRQIDRFTCERLTRETHRPINQRNAFASYYKRYIEGRLIHQSRTVRYQYRKDRDLLFVNRRRLNAIYWSDRKHEFSCLYTFHEADRSDVVYNCQVLSHPLGWSYNIDTIALNRLTE